MGDGSVARLCQNCDRPEVVSRAHLVKGAGTLDGKVDGEPQFERMERYGADHTAALTRGRLDAANEALKENSEYIRELLADAEDAFKKESIH